jgi:hypothetical protein
VIELELTPGLQYLYEQILRKVLTPEELEAMDIPLNPVTKY